MHEVAAKEYRWTKCGRFPLLKLVVLFTSALVVFSGEIVPLVVNLFAFARKLDLTNVRQYELPYLQNHGQFELQVHSRERKPLAWFLHFHKAAGSSVTELAARNNETKRLPPLIAEAEDDHDSHGHLELNQDGFRWPLVVGSSPRGASDVPLKCYYDDSRPTTDLDTEIADLVSQGVTFVSTEHWFPDLSTPKMKSIASNVTLVTVLRDPIERTLSSYYFHRCAHFRCDDLHPGACRLNQWSWTEANLYTRMLNGQPFGPLLMPGQECTRDYAQQSVESKHFEAAVNSLKQFDLVLTLNTLIKRKEAAECAIRHVLGWDEAVIPHANEGSALHPKACPSTEAGYEGVPPKAEVWEVDQAKAENMWDIKLYDYAQGLEAAILRSIGCDI